MDDRAVNTHFAQMSTGGAARAARDLVGEIIAQEQYTADLEAYKRLEAGSLTGEDAIMAFAGKRALWKLLQRLDSLDRAGQSAANRLKAQGAA